MATLSFLLDEHIAPSVSVQVKSKNSAIEIQSIQQWQKGTYRGKSDSSILKAARADSLTLVTYDVRTIPPLLKRLSL